MSSFERTSGTTEISRDRIDLPLPLDYPSTTVQRNSPIGRDRNNSRSYLMAVNDASPPRPPIERWVSANFDRRCLASLARCVIGLRHFSPDISHTGGTHTIDEIYRGRGGRSVRSGDATEWRENRRRPTR